ncbi:hypothetical protein SARC_10266 [Sphaeroforma arctica JP610]|uniref:Uncharacterized protein n=1 Tax=Sphaeroforma arctica JP610 TaxID=667725 RepID=A0A0L0FKI1_9EUKA|nr:hypothetical protein SARC_10266 [Sphaeroforma arctica JP610]KNC77270.1 hypothetical protein SARC_10266 [Sphaeroforma arctica JP610]|eukprot:XP_014151172.1 hypothetical protein SARC_10266 [Sphaeroforma arctica JP610]
MYDNHRLIDVRSTVTIVNHLTRPINIRTYPENTKAVYSDLFIDPGAHSPICICIAKCPPVIGAKRFIIDIQPSSLSLGTTYAVPITQATDRFQVRALSCHDNEKSMDPDTDFCPDFVHWSRFGMSKKERTSRTAESATEEKMME